MAKNCFTLIGVIVLGILAVTACGGPASNVKPDCKPAPVANAGLDQLIIAAPLDPKKPSLNLPQSALIGAPAIDGTSYSWAPTAGLSDPASAQPLAQPKMTTKYVLTATNACGWVTSKPVTISVYAETSP